MRRKLSAFLAVFCAAMIFLSGCAATDSSVSSTDTVTKEESVKGDAADAGTDETDAQNKENADTLSDDKESGDETVRESEKPDTADAKASSKDKSAKKDKTSKISVSDIPEYSGEPYVVLNNNVPGFTKKELVTDSYERYSKLDSSNRCRTAVACVGTDIMPKEERGSIGQIKPTGWHTQKYDCVDGKYLYNRCHLIGYQLTGENANPKNLITGTRYMNVEGMLPFENMVADYVKETDNHVMYRVIPYFKGKNLLATGVQIEAYSVEDKGDGICFNVFVYNVQPQIKIDYATGESSLKKSAQNAGGSDGSGGSGALTNDGGSVSGAGGGKNSGASGSGGSNNNNGNAGGSKNNSGSSGASGGGNVKSTYILNQNTMKFHKPDCRSVEQMNKENRVKFTGRRSDLIAKGYEPCRNCRP